MNFEKPFWKTVLREENGTASSSRLFSCVLVIASIVWVTYVTIHKRDLPDLQPVGMFLTTTTGATYGVNKITSAIAAMTGKGGPTA